jgi:CubicO group peptidase (beta-lactamase class C family)
MHNHRSISLLLLASALALILALPLGAAGPPASTALPAEVGFDPVRLARVDALLRSEVDAGHIAGATALIMRRDKVAYRKAFGMADRENQKPMRPDTLFRIASMTKSLTSVAVMMLYEEGKILLTDPIGKHLPVLAEMEVQVPGDDAKTVPTKTVPTKTVPTKTPITIRHLLTHTSGFTYALWGIQPLADMYLEGGINGGLESSEGTSCEMVEKLAELPLLHHPGERFSYGLSIDVLGCLVETLSGESLEAFFARRIFAPLGMDDSYFYPPPEKLERLAAVYQPTAGGKIERSPEGVIEIDTLRYSQSYLYTGAKTYCAGGAGMVSTADDYARFLRMMLGGGAVDGVRLLSPATVELMRQDHIGGLKRQKNTGDLLPPGWGFGLGFSVHLSGGESGDIASPGTQTWGGFYGTYFWYDPAEDLIVVLMNQLFPLMALELRARFRVAVYQAIVD